MHCLREHWEHWEHWVRKNYLPPGALKRLGAILVVAPLAFVDFARGAGAGFGLIRRAGFRKLYSIQLVSASWIRWSFPNKGVRYV